MKHYRTEWKTAALNDIEAYFESRVDQKAQTLARTTFRRNSKSRPLDESPEPAAEPDLELELAFAEAIDSLPDRQRKVIRLKLMDLDDVEIAAHLGIHRHTVRRDRLDAYLILRRLPASEGFEELLRMLDAAKLNPDAKVEK